MVEDGGKLTLQDSVVQGIIDVQGGGAFSMDYNGFGKIQYLLAQRGIPVLDTEYTDQVTIHVMVPVELQAEFAKAVTEATSGCAALEWGEQAEFAVIGDKVRIFA